LGALELCEILKVDPSCLAELVYLMIETPFFFLIGEPFLCSGDEPFVTTELLLYGG